jgi:hypothetical protein
MNYKLDLTTEQLSLLLRVLVECSSIEQDRDTRDKLIEMIRAVYEMPEKEIVEFKEATNMVNLLSMVIDDVDCISRELRCDREDLAALAITVCSQLRVQNPDNWQEKG